MVLTTSCNGGREGEEVLAKFGVALRLSRFPWLFPSSLDLCHPHLDPGGLLDYGALYGSGTQG